MDENEAIAIFAPEFKDEYRLVRNPDGPKRMIEMHPDAPPVLLLIPLSPYSRPYVR